MARVVLHGTSFSLSITLLKTVLDQWEGEFLQLGPSRTRALFFVQEKIFKKQRKMNATPYLKNLPKFCKSPNFRQSSKKPMSYLGSFQILAKQTFLFQPFNPWCCTALRGIFKLKMKRIFLINKVTTLSRFITQRVFHIPEIYCCHDTCKFLYDIAKVTVAVENFPHTQIVNKSDSYDYSQTQS